MSNIHPVILSNMVSYIATICWYPVNHLPCFLALVCFLRCVYLYSLYILLYSSLQSGLGLNDHWCQMITWDKQPGWGWWGWSRQG